MSCAALLDGTLATSTIKSPTCVSSTNKMTEWVLGVLGSLGLFLIGMSIMTDGLKALAGDARGGSLVSLVAPDRCGYGCQRVGDAPLIS